APRIRGEVLEHRRVGSRRVDHDRVLHRAARLERRDGLGDRRALLSDGDVDALLVLATLLLDRVDGDGRLARLAVADYQLPWAATNARHRGDGLAPGLRRLVHRPAANDAGRLDLEPPVRLGADRALAVEGLAERVDDPAQHHVPDRDRQDPARLLDRVALLDL